jgi:hypothetical protein
VRKKRAKTKQRERKRLGESRMLTTKLLSIGSPKRLSLSVSPPSAPMIDIKVSTPSRANDPFSGDSAVNGTTSTPLPCSPSRYFVISFIALNISNTKRTGNRRKEEERRGGERKEE